MSYFLQKRVEEVVAKIRGGVEITDLLRSEIGALIVELNEIYRNKPSECPSLSKDARQRVIAQYRKFDALKASSMTRGGSRVIK